MAHNRRRQRDITTPFDLSLDESLLSDPLETLSPKPLPLVDPLEDPAFVQLPDLRRFDPAISEGDLLRSPSDVVGRTALVGTPRQQTYNQVRKMMEFGQTPPNVQRNKFNDPRYAAECVRRKTRREVIMADPRKRKRGAGGGRRRDEWSDYHC